MRRATTTAPIVLTLSLSLAVAAPARQIEQPAADATQIRPLLIGSQVPSVQVRTLDGERVDLAEVLAGQPSLLIFYRGGW